MSSIDLITLREFQDSGLLKEFSELLQEHKIPFYVEDTKPRFDVTFANDDSRRIYTIKVAHDNLEKARQVTEAIDLETMENLPGDYYLLQFSEKELREVLLKSDEWNPFDVLLAEKLLKEKGLEIDQHALAQSRDERKEQLDAPEKAGTLLIISGYLLTFFLSFFGLIIALTLLNSKKTTLDGHRIPRYTSKTRNHAIYMILLMILQTVLYVFVLIMKQN